MRPLRQATGRKPMNYLTQASGVPHFLQSLYRYIRYIEKHFNVT
jgi:hypothetical protein